MPQYHLLNIKISAHGNPDVYHTVQFVYIALPHFLCHTHNHLSDVHICCTAAHYHGASRRKYLQCAARVREYKPSSLVGPRLYHQR